MSNFWGQTFRHHGLRIATGVSLLGSIMLMAQNGLNPDLTDLFKNVIAPTFYMSANLVGIANRPRTANTLAFLGTCNMLVSLSGIATGRLELIPFIVMACAGTGHFCGSYFAPNRWFIHDPRRPPKTSLWQYGFVSNAMIQAMVGIVITFGAIAQGMIDMVPTALLWNLGDFLKIPWAVLNAQDDIKKNTR